MYEREISRFRELLRIGVSALKEASQVYVKAIDRAPEAKQAFRELVPEVPASAWASFEKVGRGQMHEKLLLFGGRVHNLLRALPLSEQTDALENGIPNSATTASSATSTTSSPRANWSACSTRPASTSPT